MGLTEGQQEAVEHAEYPGVPAFVLHVQQAVDSVAAQQRVEQPRQVLEGHLSGGRRPNVKNRTSTPAGLDRLPTKYPSRLRRRRL